MDNTLDYEAPDGCCYDSPKQYFVVGYLGLCGCGSLPLKEKIWQTFKTLYLAKLNHGHHYFHNDGFTEAEHDLQELILHLLDMKKVIEHGSGICGSWLTEEGFELAKKLVEEQGAE